MSKQIQYLTPTNLVNYRERCKRKGIFIHENLCKFFPMFAIFERICGKSIFRKVIL